MLDQVGVDALGEEEAGVSQARRTHTARGPRLDQGTVRQQEEDREG